MKIFISVSATPTWAKGQRVVVKLAKDEWYMATVRGVRSTGVQCIADDGEVIKFDLDSTARDVKLLEAGSPVRKRPLTDAQVKAVMLKDKEAVQKRKAKEKAAAKSSKSITRRMQIKPEQRVPKTLSTPNTQQTTPVHVPPSSHNERPEFNVSYSSSSKEMLAYLNKLWAWANDEYFDKRLPKPATIRLQRDTDVSRMSRRAAWFVSRRIISVHPRLFNSTEEKVHEIFVHEMCHQAVTDLDHVTDNSNGGHGPNWKAWMVRCGLNPNRYDTHSNDVYMTDDEKEAHQERVKRRATDNAKIKDSGADQFYWRNRPEPVSYSDGRGIVYGLAAFPSDKKQTRIAVVINPYANNFMKIPTTWLHRIPESDPNYVRVTSQSFLDAAEKVRTHFDVKDKVRTMRRVMRSF